MNRYILHIDGDAYFASCEISHRPDLKGKPVVVGEERGIASALTYEAKKLGVYRGMPVFKIRQEFPEVIILSSHFELYEEMRQNLVSILKEYLPIVETYSIDECFALMPEMPEKDIEEFVRKIKKRVQVALGITFSFGVAPTKTLAKIASKKEKPDGCVILIDPEKIEKTLGESAIGSVWGIGRQTSAALLGKNIKTAKDFIDIPLTVLQKQFNEPSIETWHELKGLKIFKVSSEHQDQKSIQSTRALIKATSDKNILFSELSRNVEIACEHLRQMEMQTNFISMFYKLADGSKHRVSAQTRLSVYTNDPKIILAGLQRLVKIVYEPDLRYKTTGISFLNLRKAG